MKYCPKCHNIFEQDQEKTTEKKLFFKCRVCNYIEESTNIDDFKISHISSVNLDINVDNIEFLCEDPTIPIKKIDCNNKDCKNKYMKYVKKSCTLNVTYICCECKSYWNI
jgi:hypothetical protein